MTTINSSSPASIWLQAQSTAPAAIQTPPTAVQINATAVTDSVQLSDAALAKLNAETAALGNGSGNDPPRPPDELSLPIGDDTAMPLGNGSGNDPPRPPDRI